MAGDVIITVTLNTALYIAYAADDLATGTVNPVSRPGYQAAGRGVTVARVLRSFGHDVLAAGLAGGSSGELIREGLARSGVAAAFTLTRGESRRMFRFTVPDDPAGRVLRFAEAGPYITTEELGRFAGDYRRLLAGAAAVVLCGSLPDGLPPDIYGSLVTYAAEAGVPVILDAGGEELKLAVGHGPSLVVTAAGPAEAAPGADGPAQAAASTAAALLRLGAGAAAVAAGNLVHAVTAAGRWTARADVPGADLTAPAARAALVAGLVPGELLGWSWPDRLRHALALAAGGLVPVPPGPGSGPAEADRDQVDLAAYEQALDAITVEPEPGPTGPGNMPPDPELLKVTY